MKPLRQLTSKWSGFGISSFTTMYRVAPEEIYKILTENLPDIQKWHDRLLKIIEAGVNA